MRHAAELVGAIARRVGALTVIAIWLIAVTLTTAAWFGVPVSVLRELGEGMVVALVIPIAVVVPWTVATEDLYAEDPELDDA